MKILLTAQLNKEAKAYGIAMLNSVCEMSSILDVCENNHDFAPDFYETETRKRLRM